MMVVVKGNEIIYVTTNASTLPDLNPGSKERYSGTAIEEGIYTYNTGTHNNAYTGLRTGDMDSWYIDSNGNFFLGKADSINVHAAGNNLGATEDSSWSLGCQTIWYGDYVDFGKAVGFLSPNAPNNNLSYTNTVNGIGKNYAQSVTVTYILDRSMLPENQQAVFFPK